MMQINVALSIYRESGRIWLEDKRNKDEPIKIALNNEQAYKIGLDLLRFAEPDW